VWPDLLPGLFLLLLPLVLLAGLVAAYARNRGMFVAVGLSRREMGLLAIGPFAAMLFDVPVFISRDYFLAMNIGGAVVPVVLSLHLLWKQQPSLPKTVVGVGMVALATFMVTRVTDLGVVASFPFYLLPSVLAALLALLLCSHRSLAAPAYGYAVATLGVLVGGDLFHLPEIFSQPFMGSLGGAGLYDMVYIAGLLTICLLLPVMSRDIKRLPFPASPVSLADRAAHAGDYTLARHHLVQAVQEAAKHTALLLHHPVNDLVHSLLGPVASHDFYLLRSKPVTSAQDMARARVTARLLLDALAKKERECYASSLQRTGAFLIDFVVLAPLALLLSLAAETHISSLFFVFLFSLQFLYFVILEYWTGTTLGKALLDLSVREADRTDLRFIASFTRNTIRFFDMLLGGYLVSLLLIALSPRKQRLGDMAAGSVVVKNI